MRHRVLVPFFCASVLTLPVSPAAAQFIGTFSWQTQPHCNVITLNVTQAGNAYILEGFDDQCGAERRAPVTGTATLNPNGTVGLGLTLVNTPGGEPTHVDAALNLATLGGPWSDSAGNEGTFAFNAAAGGPQRQTSQMTLTGYGTIPRVMGRRANGTAAAPTAVSASQPLLSLEGRGYNGSVFAAPASPVRISLYANESWTPTARGAAITFHTTRNGTLGVVTRMLIGHDGRVGIGSLAPAQQLDVQGNVRIGSFPFGCVEDRVGAVIAGMCGSDARFKRDVVSFEPMLSKVAALRPVHFYWRASEFPTRAFGASESYGLVAQEVEQILPELVATDEEGYKAVNYSKLPLIALQAIKELKEKNDALERRLSALEQRLQPPVR